MIYLDWAATAIPDRDCIEKANNTYFTHFGNPSSLHSFGKEAMDIISSSREIIAGSIGAKKGSRIIFTSGGTESNNIVIKSFAGKKAAGEIIISGIEHAAVWESAGSLTDFGFKIKVLKTGDDGIISPEDLKKALSPATCLVSLMFVNNEVGVVQPMGDLVKVVRDFEKESGKQIHFHTDAVQAYGKYPINAADLDVDSLTVSAHKIGGPRGVGCLYLKKDLNGPFKGGGQEFGVRPGTENVPGIYGTALVADKKTGVLTEAQKSASQKIGALISGCLEIPGCYTIPEKRAEDNNLSRYSPYIACISIKGLPSEVIVRIMNDKGFAISSGSACNTRKSEKKFRIFNYMNVPKNLSKSSIRISIGDGTSMEDIESFIAVLKEEVARLAVIRK